MDKAGGVSPFEAVLVVAATFVIFLFLGAAFILMLGMALALVLTELLIMVVPFSYLLLKHVDIRSYVGVEIKPKFILLGIASGVFLFFFNVIILAVLTTIFGVSQVVEESNTLIKNLSTSTLGLVSVIAASSLAGVCEEFTFRGFLQNAISRRYSFVPAVIVSSMAFGLVHFDPQLVYIIAAFLIGLGLGYIYHRWHSYVVSAIAHSTVNLIAVALLLLVQ